MAVYENPFSCGYDTRRPFDITDRAFKRALVASISEAGGMPRLERLNKLNLKASDLFIRISQRHYSAE